MLGTSSLQEQRAQSPREAAKLTRDKIANYACPVSGLRPVPPVGCQPQATEHHLPLFGC